MMSVASSPKVDITGLNDNRTVIWWHSSVKKNSRDRSQPNVLVSLRVLNSDGKFGKLYAKWFPITFLGFLRIGSVWHKRQQIGQIDMETISLNGHISSSDFQIIKQCKIGFNGDRQYLIPINVYDLEYDCYPHNHTPLLQFPMETTGKLPIRVIVPCMEVFTRLYGRNAEVRRILSTYSWNEASRRLYNPDSGFKNGHKWGVELADRMIDDDAFLIAFLQHDDYTQKQAKSVFAQIEASQNAYGNNGAFFGITPWLLGDIQLRLKGFWINSNHFLALQINGANLEPEWLTIYRKRTFANPPGHKSNNGSSNHIVTNLANTPEYVEVTGEFAPDHHSAKLSVTETDFYLLGKRGEIIKQSSHSAQAQVRSTSIDTDNRSEMFSAGETYGDGKGVGKANIKSDIIIESHGILLDLWDALLGMSRSESEKKMIHNVTYLSSKGFVAGDKPTLIAFQNFFRDKSSYDFLVGSWGYLNAREQKPRGALIARVLTDRGHVFFIEIQRRKRKSRNALSNVGEEHYRGVVFKLDNTDNDSIISIIHQIMINLAEKKGVLTLSDKNINGKISTYIHRIGSISDSDINNKIMKSDRCQRIIISAIAKVI